MSKDIQDPWKPRPLDTKRTKKKSIRAAMKKANEEIWADNEHVITRRLKYFGKVLRNIGIVFVFFAAYIINVKLFLILFGPAATASPQVIEGALAFAVIFAPIFMTYVEYVLLTSFLQYVDIVQDKYENL